MSASGSSEWRRGRLSCRPSPELRRRHEALVGANIRPWLSRARIAQLGAGRGSPASRPTT